MTRYLDYKPTEAMSALLLMLAMQLQSCRQMVASIIVLTDALPPYCKLFGRSAEKQAESTQEAGKLRSADAFMPGAEAKLGSRDGLMRPPSGSMMPELAHSAGLSDQERMANLIRQCMAPLPTVGNQPSIESSVRLQPCMVDDCCHVYIYHG